MPCIGLIPFLQEFELKEVSSIDRVNALYRAYPISTVCTMQESVFDDCCVNALYRAYPISTLPLYRKSGKGIGVSMPCIGLIPFLRGRWKK